MSEIPLIHPKPIEVGALAPHFSLPSAQGSEVALEQLIHEGPVLLWFSPGMVCPFCRQHMAQLRLSYPAIKQRRAEVVQVTATPPRLGALYARRFTLPFVYLCDGDHAIHRHYGLTTRGMLTALKSSLKSFPGMVAGVVQGQQPSPFPYFAGGLAENTMEQALFLIGRDGRVYFRHIADGQAHIPSNETLLHALDALP